MSRIVLGETDSGKTVYLDIDSLVRNRLLVQANSGRGKSYFLRRAAEQLSGKVQVIIVDSEGEFASLREKYPYVLAGKGGETAADPRTAALLAHRLLDLHASAVLDIYEMKPDARHHFVQTFLDAMVDSPKNLWHPVVVLLDEAHVFCPEKGQGESIATESVINMASRGRKRGFALVAATQRLGKLSKNCSAEMLNVIIGGTFQDIDRKRAAETLGIYGTDKVRDFYDHVKMLKPGTFYALGPAISEDLLIMKTGAIETTHPEAGAGRNAAPPATPPNIAKFLPKLSDLPAEAEQKAKTEKELRDEIRDLRKQLKAQPAPVVEKISPTKVTKEEIRRAIEEEISPYRRAMKTSRKQLFDMVEFLQNLGKKFRASFESIEGIIKGLDLSEFVEPEKDIEDVQKRLQGEPVTRPQPPAVVFTPRTQLTRIVPATFDGLKPAQSKVLMALAELSANGVDTPDRYQLAAWSGYAVSGNFNNLLGSLSSGGLVTYPGNGTVRLTEEGSRVVGTDFKIPSIDTVRARVFQRLKPAQVRLLTVAIEAGGVDISTAELAERSGYQVSGNFNNLKGSLATQGLLEYPSPGRVRAASWLFES